MVSVSVHVSVSPSIIHLSVFLFLDNNLSKYQWIFTKLGVCIDIMEIANFVNFLPSYRPSTG